MLSQLKEVLEYSLVLLWVDGLLSIITFAIFTWLFLYFSICLYFLLLEQRFYLLRSLRQILLLDSNPTTFWEKQDLKSQLNQLSFLRILKFALFQIFYPSNVIVLLLDQLTLQLVSIQFALELQLNLSSSIEKRSFALQFI